MSEAAPLFPPIITQSNCSAVGMTERQFLDWCRENRPLVSKLGKLRAVPTEDLIAHLRTSRASDVGDDVDAVLASVGRQRKAG
jgi:hypothetical protein